jgi:hypothetical protein
MKKIIFFAVSFIAAGAAWAPQASTQIAGADNVPIEEYVPKVIIEGKWGTGPGEFGIAWTYASNVKLPQDESGEIPPILPSSLAVNSNGDVYVLDVVNNRIQKFDMEGKYVKSIKVESYNGKEQPIWYGSIKINDGRYVLDRVIDKTAQGTIVGVDKWFPFYWPLTSIGVNIVIDSRDTLYYYLKRTKDGKETGEVWEFRNDKLAKKFEAPVDGGVYYEAPLGLSLEEDDSIWIFNARENVVKTNKHYEIREKKKYTTKERDEKLVKAQVTNKRHKKTKTTPLGRLRELNLRVTAEGVKIIRKHGGK